MCFGVGCYDRLIEICKTFLWLSLEAHILGIHSYWLFLLTGVLLNLAPGQDTMFILGRSL